IYRVSNNDLNDDNLCGLYVCNRDDSLYGLYVCNRDDSLYDVLCGVLCGVQPVCGVLYGVCHALYGVCHDVYSLRDNSLYDLYGVYDDILYNHDLYGAYKEYVCGDVYHPYGNHRDGNRDEDDDKDEDDGVYLHVYIQ
ncbi:10866_t:CDS:1, partial [Racocetra persica]